MTDKNLTELFGRDEVRVTALEPAARLVCHQFKDEAEQETRTVIDFDERPYKYWWHREDTPSLQALKLATSHVNMDNNMKCQPLTRGISYSLNECQVMRHLETLQILLNKRWKPTDMFPNLKTFHMEVKIQWEQDRSEHDCDHRRPHSKTAETLRAHLRGLTDNEWITSLEVKKALVVREWSLIRSDEDEKILLDDGVWRPWMKWDKQNGWQSAIVSKDKVVQVEDDSEAAEELSSEEDILLRNWMA